MIYDGLSEIGRYRGLYKGLDVLISWLEEHDPYALEPGRHEILGSKVFANVMDTKTRLPEDASYEVHRRYLDVQMDVEGCECFKTTSSATVPLGEFDVEGDGGLCEIASEEAIELEGSLGHGRFAVFVVGEPHMPNLACPGERPGSLRKICFKVLDDRFWDD